MIAVKYAIFSIISIFVNLLSQYLSFLFYSGFIALYIAMFLGTFSGLLVKYILDKKFIFYYQIQNKTEDLKKFTLYSIMGVFTTIIFWTTEIAFDAFFKNDYAKYMGAILGLSIGYIIKYSLDRRFVFIQILKRSK